MKKLMIILLSIVPTVLNAQNDKVVFEYHESLKKFLLTQYDREVVKSFQIDTDCHLMAIGLITVDVNGEILNHRLVEKSTNRYFNDFVLTLLNSTNGKWAILASQESVSNLEIIIPFVLSAPKSWNKEEEKLFKSLIERGENLELVNYPDLEPANVTLMQTIANKVYYSSH